MRKISELSPPLREVLFAILEEMERQYARMEEQVTRSEFNELKEIVRDLGETVKELAEAQKRTEERLEHFERQTEENFKRVWQAINELAEAQKRTEERLNELAEAQKRTEERLNELAEAQKRTEEEIAKLARGLQRVRKEVGGLSRTISYALENEAYRHLPSLLKEKLGLEVQEKIVRTFVAGEEINIFARARRNGEEVLLVGEAVLKLDDVAKLKQVWKKVEAVKEEIGGEVVPIVVTHFALPKVLERAERAGMVVVQSFEWV
ncbi:hypothetical protein [Thermosulfurimonas sp. F29]|uniref:hypothetical protein n=1 Tax=Thermosulfurimonas sp. F29 TaxID=2867247 RepID=UPI001C82AEFA|nr:hypothetical protein [Thermosulfurimonas sp. F29]MBX6423044.1 hypothetical protein [Thermosulfurimonas sp. F29]